MEEQRARQEDEARKVQAQSATESGAGALTEATNEEALLEQAISMSIAQESTDPTPSVPDFASMSEEDQINYAMQMSLQNSGRFARIDQRESLRFPTRSDTNQSLQSQSSYKKSCRFKKKFISRY